MLKEITIIAGAITAICSIITIIYKHFSPKYKLKKKAIENGKAAVDAGDTSGITSVFDKLRRKIMPPLVIVLLLFVGCRAPNVMLSVISPQDIISLKAGEDIVWYDQQGQRHTGAPQDGCFLSNTYIKNVMDAKVQ